MGKLIKKKGKENPHESWRGPRASTLIFITFCKWNDDTKSNLLLIKKAARWGQNAATVTKKKSRPEVANTKFNFIPWPDNNNNSNAENCQKVVVRACDISTDIYIFFLVRFDMPNILTVHIAILPDWHVMSCRYRALIGF